ncbi:hypothetical protein ES703_123947 [subsurface metagenome]
MKLADLVESWPKTFAIIALTVLLFWGYSCQPKVASLITEGKQVGRAELQIELDTIVATAEFRLADLDRQEAFQDLIFKNALVMVETGTLNPVGIITMLAGLYGISRGAKDLKDRVEKKSENS